MQFVVCKTTNILFFHKIISKKIDNLCFLYTNNNPHKYAIYCLSTRVIKIILFGDSIFCVGIIFVWLLCFWGVGVLFRSAFVLVPLLFWGRGGRLVC